MNISWLPLRKASCFRCLGSGRLEVAWDRDARGIVITRFWNARCVVCGVGFIFTAMRPPGIPEA